ncbi:bifunctional Tetratricopeptide-like helical domain superfamily/Pentatricopeptide repeat [Babesia duncani]|uniref:Bifunctional Tetratricopeptide-like helical domain superfamily/Pentatricopeptide repeat n=1 Tax=Babesia duncani TaxID=323732 RepID=A0AAD9PNE3_9APIC|nr:bifunctional Tetratricopeptide-like helical domain superfamily/Pentatricopeptide repeat [Babesia duncani]
MGTCKISSLYKRPTKSITIPYINIIDSIQKKVPFKGMLKVFNLSKLHALIYQLVNDFIDDYEGERYHLYTDRHDSTHPNGKIKFNYVMESIFGPQCKLDDDSRTQLKLSQVNKLPFHSPTIARQPKWRIGNVIQNHNNLKDEKNIIENHKRRNVHTSLCNNTIEGHEDAVVIIDKKELADISLHQVIEKRLGERDINTATKLELLSPKDRFLGIDKMLKNFNINNGAISSNSLSETSNNDISTNVSLGKNPELETNMVPGYDTIGRYDYLLFLKNQTIQSLFDQGMATLENLNSLMKERGLRGEVKECLSILAEMKQSGIKVSTETYNNMLIGCMHNKNPKVARYLYLCLKADVLEPDLKTFTLLIKTHVDSGDVAGAFSLYRKMEKDNIKADLVLYTVLISGLIKVGQIDNAWRFYNYMRTWRLIEPDQVLFGIMIKSCVKTGDAEKALCLYDEMIKMLLHPTNIVYEELIHCLSQRREFFQKCFHFYNQLKLEQHPISPRVILYLLRACEVTGNSRKARHILVEAEQLKIPIGEEMYIATIRVIAGQIRYEKMSEIEKMHNLQRVWQIVHKMIQSNIMLGTKLLNSLILVYENACYHDYALDVLQYFPLFNAIPDHMTYFILLRMLGPKLQDPGRFFTLWNSIKNHITPRRTFLCMALDMAIVSKSAKRTLEVLNDMYAAKAFPTSQLMKRLYSFGKSITEIHMMINNLVSLQRQVIFQKRKKESEILSSYMLEHKLKSCHNL